MACNINKHGKHCPGNCFGLQDTQDTQENGTPSAEDGDFLKNQPYYADEEPEENEGKYFLLSAVVLLAVAVIIAVVR